MFLCVAAWANPNILDGRWYSTAYMFLSFQEVSGTFGNYGSFVTTVNMLRDEQFKRFSFVKKNSGFYKHTGGASCVTWSLLTLRVQVPPEKGSKTPKKHPKARTF